MRASFDNDGQNILSTVLIFKTNMTHYNHYFQNIITLYKNKAYFCYHYKIDIRPAWTKMLFLIEFSQMKEDM